MLRNVTFDAWVSALALATLVGTGGFVQAASGPQFVRDVRPVLSDNCYPCHGPDPDTRKAKLRLDTREGLFGETREEGPLVTAGDLGRSALWKRVVTEDRDDVMPPPESHKALTAEQKEAIRGWILGGAAWQSHWAFERPVRPAVPAVRDGSWVRNPIDAFVLARLEEKGLGPAPEADRWALARRVALDLTGLPPSPGMVRAWARDRSGVGYERLVRELLASPHWGEHRARAWLDVARYADTHGLHFDNYREIYPYRDWVVRAFNRNQPFDQFTIEQLAGDLLEEPTQDQLVATGFHRCAVTTNEGGTIEEENLALYANDRVTTTSWVWLGLTANCASCHDHKFDPITMRDFYSMAAFFRNTTQTGYDGNARDSAPSITVFDDPKEEARWQELPGLIQAAQAEVEARRTNAEPAFARWVGKVRPAGVRRSAEKKGLVFHAPLRDGAAAADRAVVRGQPVTGTSAGARTERADGPLGPAPAFPKEATVAFADAGDFGEGQAFSVGAWVWVPPGYDGSGAVVARMDEKDGHRGWDLYLQKRQWAMHVVNHWPERALKVRTQNVVRPGQWQHVLATYDGSGKPAGVRFYVDGFKVETEVENNRTVQGTIRTAAPLRLAQRSEGAHFDDGALQDVRLYGRVVGPLEVLVWARPEEFARWMAESPAAWKPEFRTNLFEYYLTAHDRPYRQAEQAWKRLEQERDALKRDHPVTLIQREKKEGKPVAHILFRGQYDQKREEVGPDTFGVLPPFPAGAPRNRLGLARWMVSPEHPLTARVIANRFWQEVFGVGLVKTSEDFGSTGEPPVNQALLDWLAVEFQESGWDVKHLFELMVTSATYRQSAVVTAEKLERDPDNRLLSRGPRFRLDAEVMRDQALAVSGLLARRLGGASVRPYQPDGIWEAVAMPESDTKKYERSTGEGLYRRSLYTFWKRAAPPALMDILNAPSREVSCPRRERTNTPLQALATLNDPQFVEAARRLAERGLRQARGRPERALEWMAWQVLLRPLRPAEQPILSETFGKVYAYYAAHPEEAARLVAVGESKVDPKLDAAQVAALTLVANNLLNLDEVLNK